MIKVYNDDDILVAESETELSLSIQELIEGCGYKIIVSKGD